MNNDVEEKKILKIINSILPQLIVPSKTSDEIANNHNIYDFRQIMKDASQNFMKCLGVEKKIDQRLIDDVLAEIRDAIEDSEGESLQDGHRDAGEIAKIIPLFPKK